MRIRGGAVRFIAWLRAYGTRAGLRTGRFGTWVHTYRGVLRGAAVGLAVLIFVFLDRPTGLTILLIAVLLALCLAVIQFFDQPAAMTDHAGTTGRAGPVS